MNQNEANAVLNVLRASTIDQRKAAMWELRRVASRVGSDWQETVQGLIDETKLAVAQKEGSAGRRLDFLRPLVDATMISHDVEKLIPGPDPICSEAVTLIIDEWCDAWDPALVPKMTAAGVSLPGALLLSGLPGTGKSTMTRAIARRFDGKRGSVILDCHRTMGSHLGETGEKLTKTFAAARQTASLLVIEEVDAIGIARASQSDAKDVGEMNRITIAVMRLLDTVQVPVVLTTNRADMLDPALLRRCEFHVEMPMPDNATCVRIVADVLGQSISSDFALTISLIAAVPLAKRARRLAFLRGTDAVAEFGRLAGGALVRRRTFRRDST
jgi:hypothetical protein